MSRGGLGKASHESRTIAGARRKMGLTSELNPMTAPRSKAASQLRRLF